MSLLLELKSSASYSGNLPMTVRGAQLEYFTEVGNIPRSCKKVKAALSFLWNLAITEN